MKILKTFSVKLLERKQIEVHNEIERITALGDKFPGGNRSERFDTLKKLREIEADLQKGIDILLKNYKPL